MNVAQELGDNDLYNYDVLIKLLGERFDPASRVSASRSRFHARSRRHHEDADAIADALADVSCPRHTYIVRPNRPSQCINNLIPIQKRSRIKMTSSLWATVHLGIEELRIHPHLLAYNRCSHWHVVWDMKCAQLPDNRMLSVDLRETIPLLTRIVDFVPQHGPAEITHEISVSAAVNLAICRVVARDRTLPCRLNQQDGTSNPTTGLLGTATTTVRETLNRSGHHPHRSIRPSSGPIVIFSCHIDLVTSNEGN